MHVDFHTVLPWTEIKALKADKVQEDVHWPINLDIKIGQYSVLFPEWVQETLW